MLLFQHCEKGIAGLLAIAAAYLVYASLGVEGETRRPQELRDKVTQTKAAFDGSKWSDLGEEHFDPAYDPSNRDAIEITQEKYAGSGTGWDSPVVRPMVDRTDPVLLAATDLEGTGVTGLMAFVDDNIRKQRELEELRRVEEEAREREKERGRDQENPLLGGGERRGAPGMRGGDDGNGKRRPVPNRISEPGVMPQGDERIQTVSCAVVLAKAPSLDQFNRYKEALEGSRGYDPSRDVPNYVGYYVERADVTGGKKIDWTPIGVGSITGGRRDKALTAKSLNRMIGDWIPGQEPMVDDRYEHPALTVPLPPLVGQAWGPAVVHSDAPLQAETDAAELEEENEEEKDPAGDGEDELFASNEGRDGRNGPGRGELGGRGQGRGLRGSRRGMGRGIGGGAEMGMGMGMMEMGGGGRGAMGGRRGEGRGTGVFDPEIPFVMVRFFDFSVLPGHQYRYRLRLILKDVNREPGVDPRALAREVSERIKKSSSKYAIRLAEWSEPSPVISIPMAGGVSVAGAKVPSSKQPNAEGSVQLLVQSYALDENRRATKAGVIKSFRRGAVVNLTEDAEIITPDRRWIEKVDSFKFHTGVTLCDFSGGGTIGGKIKAPVNVLLMDATGKLFVHNELDDSQTVTDHKLIFDSKTKGREGRGGGGEMEFPGMGMGRGGRR